LQRQVSQPQVAAGAQGAGQAGAHAGQAFSQQAGAQGAGQAFSQQAGAQGAGQAFSQQAGAALVQQAGSGQHLAAGAQAAGPQVAQVSQPPQFRPNRRFIRSPASAWLARAALTRSAPKKILPFIEQQLLYNELG
jgi:hypothetical protein